MAKQNTIELTEILKQCDNNISSEGGIKKETWVQKVKELTTQKALITASGIVEILSEGFGFLRLQNFCTNNTDIYISHQVIKKYDLRAGDFIEIIIASPKDNDRNLSVMEVTSVNQQKPGYSRPKFDNLEAIYPEEQIKLECSELPHNRNISMRILDVFCPIGKGQRVVCIAPPRTGKTELLHSIAFSIRHNYPNITLMVVLIDERPEEVGLMKQVAGDENVISSTFDEHPSKHVQVAKLVTERAKRLVEMGHDVVLLLDSMTRLTRAFNQTVPSSGKPGTGGIESLALTESKKIVGAARNTREKGSLTQIFTVLTGSDSKMDDIIAEEIKGTCNAEIILDRIAAQKRLFPALDMYASGTRREESFRDRDLLRKIDTIRKILQSSQKMDSLELIIDRFSKTKTNAEFFATMTSSSVSRT